MTNVYAVYKLFLSRLSCEETTNKNKKKERKMAEKKLTGYCVKCRAKSEFKNAKEVKMKNGRPALKGVCAKCGTGMYRILSAKKK